MAFIRVGNRLSHTTLGVALVVAAGCSDSEGTSSDTFTTATTATTTATSAQTETETSDQTDAGTESDSDAGSDSASDSDQTSDSTTDTTAGPSETESDTDSESDSNSNSESESDSDTDGPGAGLQPLALDVDAGGNGVLEPGESVSAIPTWSNPHADTRSPTATAHDIQGPDGAAYQLLDDIGAYTVEGESEAACDDCYQVSVNDPATRPESHWDLTFDETLEGGTPATWLVHVGETFTDVPTSNPDYTGVEALVHHDITDGCAVDLYCPDDDLTRAQAAGLLAAAITGGKSTVPETGTVPGLGTYDCSIGGTSVFDDVAPDSFACKFIHYIASVEITLGCPGDPPQFCPTDPTRRSHLALFSARALEGGEPPVSYTDPMTNRSYNCEQGMAQVQFSDTNENSVFCAGVHYMWARGLMDGCTDTTFCPTDPAPRDVAAGVIARSFELSVNGPQ